MARSYPLGDPMAPNPKMAYPWAMCLMFLMALASLSLLLISAIKRTANRAGHGKRAASPRRSQSEPNEEEYDEDLAEEEEEEEIRMGRRTRVQMEADKKKKWLETMPKRGFKNERQVDLDSLGADFPGMSSIIGRGMRFWFLELPGYNKKVVIEFYQKMSVTLEIGGSGSDEIKAKIGRHTVVVTPDRIARYLGYIRPASSTLSYPGVSIPDLAVADELYENRGDYQGTFRPGYFKEGYRLLNKAIQANLFPRSSGHRLTKEGAELLYIFTHVEYGMDCALWIFYQLVAFHAKSYVTAKIPFPCMITHFCRSDGIKGGAYETMEALEPGVIDMQGMMKSRAQSKPTTVPTEPSTSQAAGPSQPAPRPRNRIKDLLKRIFCQTVEIRKEQKVLSKRQTKMEHAMAWQNAQIQAQTGIRYVPPADVVEEEEGEEEMPLMSDSDE